MYSCLGMKAWRSASPIIAILEPRFVLVQCSFEETLAQSDQNELALDFLQ